MHTPSALHGPEPDQLCSFAARRPRYTSRISYNFFKKRKTYTYTRCAPVACKDPRTWIHGCALTCTHGRIYIAAEAARSRLGSCQGISSIKNGNPIQRLATPLTSLVYVELNIITLLYSTIFIRLQHRPLESRQGVIANRCQNPRFGPLLYQKLSPKNLSPSIRGINFAKFISRGG